MQTPKEVLLATQTFQNQQDPLAEYLVDRCVRGGENVRVTRNDLFADYLSWCVQTGEKFPLSRNAFFDHIRGMKDVTDSQWRMAGIAAPARGFLGIGLVANSHC